MTAVRPMLVRFLTLDYLSVVLNFGVVRFVWGLMNGIQKIHKQPLLELAPVGLGKLRKADTCATRSVGPDHQATGVDICLGVGEIQNQV